MSKKFKNIENDESFKNFKLEDYMPSMPEHKQEDSFSVAEPEPVVEAGNLFPILDEPDTSAEQVTEPETSAGQTMRQEKQRRITLPWNELSPDVSAANSAGCHWTNTVPPICECPRLPTASPCSSVGRYVTGWTRLCAASVDVA